MKETDQFFFLLAQAEPCEMRNVRQRKKMSTVSLHYVGVCIFLHRERNIHEFDKMP